MEKSGVFKMERFWIFKVKKKKKKGGRRGEEREETNPEICRMKKP